jgi:phosphoribosylformylglycinamidine synthase
VVGRPDPSDQVRFCEGETARIQASRTDLWRRWSETSYRMQALRDDPTCAQEAFDTLLDAADPGISPLLCIDESEDRTEEVLPVNGSSARGLSPRPKVAILREQGVNGQIEMAAAFHAAGFEAVDVHMSDLARGRQALDRFVGLAACGGFSYGDVLGAGGGWAKGVLFHPDQRRAFEAFFARPDTFSLGVCNGCQMMSQIKDLIPGAEDWPRFVRNRSEQFEARLSQVRIEPGPSLFFAGMAGSRLPVAVAHGEGRALFSDGDQQTRAHVAARFVDGRGEVAQRYPANPNGSPEGITALTSADGRATILMPHPERVFRTVALSWHPPGWPDESPWMRFFKNARAWVG